jgi:UDPglucose--hexose-1-phosphate uridylyltransferase
VTELRRDPATGDWLLIAPRRAALPRATGQDNCPFCPGNEAVTPPELARVQDDRGRWLVRVTANKYPLADTHEVVIESPSHHWDMTGHRQVGRVLRVWRDRYRVHCATHQVVVIFRNHDPAAGASQAHPHSQIVALTAVPPGLASRNPPADVLRAVVDRERSDRTRLIGESRRFAAFVPYAGDAYETWIVPLAAAGSFTEATDDDLGDLAALLPQILGSLRRALHDPPYNLMINSGSCSGQDPGHCCWYLRIIPRLATPGGFELATGVHVSTVTPEAAAGLLRVGIAGS